MATFADFGGFIPRRPSGMGLSNLLLAMKTTPVCPILAALLAFSPALFAEERGPGRDGQRPDQRQPRGADMWKRVDKDQDGAISRDEFAQMERLAKLPEDKRAALFDRLDKNSDGQIDRTEMHQGRPKPGQGRPDMPRIWELDKNQDGGVSFGEFQAGRMFSRLDPEKQKRMFSRLDTNGDGVLGVYRFRREPLPAADTDRRQDGDPDHVPGGAAAEPSALQLAEVASS